jgi:fructokinase
MMTVYGSIEAGGTKFRCAIATAVDSILAEAVFPTRSPAETLADVTRFFTTQAAAHGQPDAIGIGSFGPLDLDPRSATHGQILRTPKPLWSGADIPAWLRAALGCRVVIDTDVNASGLAEARLGTGRGLPSLAYMTIGTGIGGGLIYGGAPLHGVAHPEMGHIRPRRATGDHFVGCCPYHADCLEGLASGAAIFARTGRHLAETPTDDPLWRHLAFYLAQACANLLLYAAPHRIVLGGGVMDSNPGLFAPIRAETAALLNGYFGSLHLDEMIVAPGLGDRAGLTGGLLLAGA